MNLYHNVASSLGVSTRKIQRVIEVPSDEEDAESDLGRAGDPADTSLSYRRRARVNSNSPSHDFASAEGISEAFETLESTVHELKRNIDGLIQVSSKTTGKKSKFKIAAASANEQFEPERKEVLNLGRKYALLCEAFPDESWFERPKPTSASVAHPYGGREALLDSRTLAIYEMIPEVYHGAIQTSKAFRSTFLEGANALIQKVVKDARDKTAYFIFDMKHLQGAYKAKSDRSNIPEFSRLIVWQDDELKYRRFLPVHFPDQKYDLKHLFKVPALALVIRSILFGPGSIEAKALDNDSWKPPAGTYGRKWGVTSLTPGLIALAATIAVHLHLPDKKFQAIGDITGFNYQKAFSYYKKFLVRGQTSEDTSTAEGMKSLFAWYDEIIFPASKKSHAEPDVEEDSEGEDEITAALEAMKLVGTEGIEIDTDSDREGEEGEEATQLGTVRDDRRRLDVPIDRSSLGMVL